MWLLTRYGFYSIACAGDEVVIRARRKAHLQNLQARFPAIGTAPVELLAESDCRYRLLVSKADWAIVVAALGEERAAPAAVGPEQVDALHRAWDAMYGLQPSERQRVLVQRSDDGAIVNAEDLTADDLAEDKVLCPACGRKVFVSWPEGWDGHAGYACVVAGETPEERKANFKHRYRRLFR